MLDYARLNTPASSGDVLIEPSLASTCELLRRNLANTCRRQFSVCGRDADEYRSAVRVRLGIPLEQPVVALGHQPEFCHSGVWIKYAVTQHIAEQCDAAGIHVVVDHDNMRAKTLVVPCVEDGRVRPVHVPIEKNPSAERFSQLAPWSEDDVAWFAGQLREANPQLVRPSLMDNFLDGFSKVPAPRDWVCQYMLARQKVDAEFGIHLTGVRATDLDYTALFAELIGNAHEFATSYNKALKTYRSIHHIQGTRHPIPDLEIRDDRVELPIWSIPPDGSRRRVYVATGAGRLAFFAGRKLLAEFARDDFKSWDRARLRLDELAAGVLLQPRALAFTLWARLFLCDFFVHGIGGAKYDRITDMIIQDYFGIEAPHLMCVSASLRLDLPHYDAGFEEMRELRRRLRDMHYNPQRWLPRTEQSRALFERRSALVAESKRLRQESPHEHDARTAVFRNIREVNNQLADLCRSQIQKARARLDEATWQTRSNTNAFSREYFYCLFPKTELRQLQERILEVASSR